MRRLRVFLQQFHARELCHRPARAHFDPAFMSIDERAWNELAVRFKERARAKSIAPDQLWRDLALLILSGDHFVASSALGIGLRL